jgi:protein SCO1/2
VVFGAAAGLVSVVLAGCSGGVEETAEQPDNPGGAIVSGVEDSKYHGAELSTPYAMPDITLTATNEESFNLVTDTGYPVTIVFFGYTHCPDVCQLVMSDITAAMLQLPDDVAAQTQMVFVTTDPRRDTPSVLRQYLDRYNSDFVGLTGDLDDIVAAADAMGVPIEGMRRLPGGGYEVGHGAQVIGFQGDKAPVIWTHGTPVSDLAAGITALAGP